MKANNLITIAHIETDFSDKFGIPRQSGLVETTGRIIFEKEYRDPQCIMGLSGFDYIWLIWGFSKNRERPFTATVRPPRIGGLKRMGVFATRSPYRPNAMGLSSVKIDRIDMDTPKGPVIYVKGADLLDGTPIYDIKPYLPYTDSHQGRAGWSDATPKSNNIAVEFPPDLMQLLPEGIRQEVFDLLCQDPRPGYDYDKNKTFAMAYGGYDIHFKIEDNVLIVYDVHVHWGRS